MAVYTLRPNADTKNEWTTSTGIDAWAVTNDAVTQPTAPTVPGQYIQSPGANKGIKLLFESLPALAHDEYVDEIVAWAYLTSIVSESTFYVSNAASSLSTLTTTVTEQWVSRTITSPGVGAMNWTPTGAGFISQAGSGSGNYVYAVYLSVTTSIHTDIGPELHQPSVGARS